MNKFLKLLFLILGLFILIVLFYPMPITLDNYYIVSKEERLKMIDNLKKNCLSENIVFLISTYSDKNDNKNAKCWNDYRFKCFKAKENNQSLQLSINCSQY